MVVGAADYSVYPVDAVLKWRHTLNSKWTFAWRMSFRAIGWAFPLASVAALGLTMLFPDLRSRSIEIVIPLVAALQAAFVFAPDDEPALELMLAAPRPTAWIVYERLAALLLAQVSIGMVWSLLLARMPGMPTFDALVVSWLPPTLALVGLACAVTFMMRRSSFGVLTGIFVYAALLFAGDSAVAQWNFTWIVHLFMQREFTGLLAWQWGLSADVLYAANRVFAVLIGAAAVAWVVVSLRNEEKVLGAGNRSS